MKSVVLFLGGVFLSVGIFLTTLSGSFSQGNPWTSISTGEYRIVGEVVVDGDQAYFLAAKGTKDPDYYKIRRQFFTNETIPEDAYSLSVIDVENDGSSNFGVLK